MSTAVRWMDRHQVWLYLAALAGGAVLGLLVPGVGRVAKPTITPLIALLLYVTFLGVPFIQVGRAVQDVRFMATVLALNFAVVPVVVWGLSRFVAYEPVLLVGVLLVLLTPCVDYVIVFTGLAGGSHDQLLAATPLLMGLQMLLLPLYLWWFAGRNAVAAIDLAPFVEAFLVLIVLPLGAAVLTQVLGARVRSVARWQSRSQTAMVPLMVLTLGAVVASQIAGVGERIGALAPVVPIYVAFAAVMVALGTGAGRLASLDVRDSRALVFSGVTRNSLVVLPLALALPAGFELVPLVVVTQTLVELVVMVVLVRLLPGLLPER